MFKPTMVGNTAYLPQCGSRSKWCGPPRGAANHRSETHNPLTLMRPLRVLHVLGSMNAGGVEAWLMHVLRHIDRKRFEIHFLVHTDEHALYDDELVELGATILRCTNTANPLSYARQFLRNIRRNGPFDVLHSHVHHFSGFVLALGRLAGIPVRIGHSHSDTSDTESAASFFRRAYLGLMERLLLAHCTQGFAVSRAAAEALFGLEWHADARLRVLYCGIDLGPFRTPFDSLTIRTDLGISEGDVVFGHVGRFSPVKNHAFFLEIAKCILDYEPRAKFLFVGDGPLRPDIERRAAVLGMKDRIVFAGLRSDVPRLMMGAMDVFLLPSVHEGLPLVLMEAQAAGLPCVVADVVTVEAQINAALIRRLSLSTGAHEWARVAVDVASASRFADRRTAIEVIDSSRFDITQGIEQMCEVYLAGCRRDL